ncbi:hypothetical protein SCACP_27920 [Sporomusa carbonis]|uniref:substrate-binding domain-containing protein n=1 Tax=Sporomusa carbonis TaxID=3076075 RepID=UPI003A77C827
MSDNVSYTPAEVAKILKLSRFTVYDLIKRGELVAYRAGERKMRIEAADLEHYKNKTKQAGTTLPPVPAAVPVAVPPVAKTVFGDQDGLIICGQDVLLDVLARHLEKQMPHVRFLRYYAGSIDGLTALYRGTANVVTAHLWDGDTDEYNVPYVRRLLPGQRTVIINLAYRMEGFYVAAGNPKNITTWTDLTKPDVRMVNRERGSGARVLLDEKLRQLDIDPEFIQGYDHEEMSHLAVASYVARGAADVGLGVEKAAMQVRNLDFVPLQKERYDLVLLRRDLAKPHFQALLAALASPAFREEVAGMSGYDISRMGEQIAEI